MNHLKLIRRERNQLERQLKTALTIRVYRRTLAMLEIADGKRVADVARLLRVSREGVYGWLAAYTQTRDPASLIDRERSGRPSFWTGEATAALCDAMAHSPDTLGYTAVNWTIPLLREHIDKRIGAKPSEDTVRRQLARLDYAWKRPRHTLQDARSPRVRRRLGLLRRKVRNLPAGCAKLFEDETDLLLYPPLRAGWFLRGQSAEVAIKGENAKRTVFGAINIETGHRILVSRGGACAIDFHVILRQIRQEYGSHKVALLLDRASRHTAATSERLARSLEIQLLWLPSRCVNINPMDRLWHWGKEKICANRQHASIDTQAEFFIEYLRKLSPQEAVRMAGLCAKKFWLFRGGGACERRLPT
jgi:transposase